MSDHSFLQRPAEPIRRRKTPAPTSHEDEPPIVTSAENPGLASLGPGPENENRGHRALSMSGNILHVYRMIKWAGTGT